MSMEWALNQWQLLPLWQEFDRKHHWVTYLFLCWFRQILPIILRPNKSLNSPKVCFGWVTQTSGMNAGKLIKHLNTIINNTPGKKTPYSRFPKTSFLIYDTRVRHSHNSLMWSWPSAASSLSGLNLLARTNPLDLLLSYVSCNL